MSFKNSGRFAVVVALLILVLWPRHLSRGGGTNKTSGLASGGLPSADALNRQLIGAWTFHLDPWDVIYQFDPGGSFTLTFDGRFGGRAGGKWRVESSTLIMDNAWSEVPYTTVGERETAQVDALSADTLRLRTTDLRGVEEVLSLRKVPGIPPFDRGKTDNPKIVGAYLDPNGFRMELASDGAFNIANGQVVGEWSYENGVLKMRRQENRPPQLNGHRPATGPAYAKPVSGTTRSTYASTHTAYPTSRPTDATTRPSYASTQPAYAPATQPAYLTRRPSYGNATQSSYASATQPASHPTRGPAMEPLAESELLEIRNLPASTTRASTAVFPLSQTRPQTTLGTRPTSGPSGGGGGELYVVVRSFPVLLVDHRFLVLDVGMRGEEERYVYRRIAP